MNNTQYVSAEIVNILKELAFSSNLSIDKFYNELSIDPGARLTTQEFEKCVEWLMVASSKPWLGLEFGSLNIMQYGILGPLAATSESLFEALQVGTQYNILLHPLIGLSVKIEGKHVIARYSLDGEMPSLPFYAEAFMTGIFSWYKYFTGKSCVADYVSFRHAEPSYSENYRELFGCDVLFNQPFDEAKIEGLELELPLKTSSPYFHEELKQQASQERDDMESFSDVIKRFIRSSICEDIPLEQIVKKLHTSERSVQRKLSKEKTNFNTLKQEVRKEEAIRLLETTTLNIEQIAFQLGYEQRSSFAAAFQRWTGKNPTQWRNR